MLLDSARQQQIFTVPKRSLSESTGHSLSDQRRSGEYGLLVIAAYSSVSLELIIVDNDPRLLVSFRACLAKHTKNVL